MSDRDRPVRDVFDAFYRVTHDHGVERLARSMGMSPGVLWNKANPNESSHHKPTLADVVQVSVLTGDVRILHALAQTLGYVCTPVPDLSRTSDAALLELVAKVAVEGGQFHAVLCAALNDGGISTAELTRLHAEAFDWIGAIVETLSRCRGLSDGR
jgi:hypothetical protein